ncbi:hypothetical protein FFWV33_12570 [Flavobacterium faecale]|uniref:Uncharacterized protein n=1 Tax=Flavobacterium faecale TaxID=1355330 RepID=A0A2S1LEX0_9FLAO|nr:hypothetical protein FFWV33_12570 [Flavobacterium faecale]
MGTFLQKLFLALGGFSLWIYALFCYHVRSVECNTSLAYHLFENDPIKNKSGFSPEGIRTVLGIGTFIALILLIDYFD